jgi:uncharacterized protein (DUF1330 family)
VKTHTMALLAGIAIGATAVQGLRAQTAKPKAYSVSELETLDAAALAAYLPAARKAIDAAHGHALRTAAGRVVQIEGTPAPKSAAIVEWDSVDDAVAFYKSKAWADLARATRRPKLYGDMSSKSRSSVDVAVTADPSRGSRGGL